MSITWSQDIVDTIRDCDHFRDEVDLLWDTFPSGNLKWEHVLIVHDSIQTDLVPSVVKAALQQEGFTVRGQQREKKFAGFSRNPHTRWQECPSHGGSGMSHGTWVGAGNASHKPG